MSVFCLVVCEGIFVLLFDLEGFVFYFIFCCCCLSSLEGLKLKRKREKEMLQHRQEWLSPSQDMGV